MEASIINPEISLNLRRHDQEHISTYRLFELRYLRVTKTTKHSEEFDETVRRHIDDDY